MKRIKTMLNRRFTRIIPSFALRLGVASVSDVCIAWFHQPKVPEQMKKFE